MTTIEMIHRDLKAITEAQMDGAEARIDAPAEGETVIGVARLDSVRRAVALAWEYERRSELLRHKGSFDIATEAEAAIPLSESCYMATVAELVKDIAWAEIRRHLGRPAWEGRTLGIRRGYQIVSPRAEPTVRVATINAGSSADDIRKALFGVLTPEPEPEPKPKTVKPN